MTATRPETVDRYGVRHRHRCPMPEPTTGRTIAGIRVDRCPACGAVRLCGAIELRTTEKRDR